MSLAPAQLRPAYRRQAAWFAAERSRLLRKADVARRRRVLDLGTGTGEVLPELARRCRGLAVGLDCDLAALKLFAGPRVAGRAEKLPFPDGAFDLVFAQMFFMWARPLEAVIAEIRRVLAPGGALVAAAEPDYGGLIEHPAGSGALRALAARLSAEGADVEVGRRLGGALERAGFSVECAAHPARPLEAARPGSAFSAPELAAGAPAPAGGGLEFLYLPYFSFLATAGRP